MAKKPMKSMKKDEMKKDEMKKDKAMSLTAAQKKLPPALQAAMLKKMKKK